METQQSAAKVDYSSRARLLRGKGASRIQEENEMSRSQQIGGLSKKKFWETKVRTKEDAIQYYSIFYPQYPEVLVKAITARLEEIIVKHNSGEELSAIEAKVFEVQDKDKQEQHWDPLADLEKHKLQGQIALSLKRLEALQCQ